MVEVELFIYFLKKTMSLSFKLGCIEWPLTIAVFLNPKNNAIKS